MAIDIGKFLRLKSSIEAAMSAVPTDQAAVAAGAMMATYDRIRAEVADVVSDEQSDEFSSLFPETVTNYPGLVLGASSKEAAKYNSARVLLGSLAGWLDGFVAEARMQKEADAYAAARVKEERGVGFAQGTSLTARPYA
jgi:hypothetical protein